MLKSFASLFGSLGWMILRVMLVIGSLVGAVILIVTGFFESVSPLQRILSLLGALACVALFIVLVRAGKKEDETPVEGDKDRFR